jgi:type IV secretory pathway VirB10-like protein
MSTTGAPLGPDDIHDPIPTNGTLPNGSEFKTGTKVEGVQKPIGTKGLIAIGVIVLVLALAFLDGMNLIHIDLGFENLIPSFGPKPNASPTSIPITYNASNADSSLGKMLTDTPPPTRPNFHPSPLPRTAPNAFRQPQPGPVYSYPPAAPAPPLAATPNLDSSGPHANYNPNDRYPGALASPTPSAKSIKEAQDAAAAEYARNSEMTPGAQQSPNPNTGQINNSQPQIVAQTPYERPNAPSLTLQQLSASRFGHPEGGGYLVEDREPALSKYEIWPGRKLELQFDDAIIVDNPGLVCAHLTKPVKDSLTGTVVLLPEQTILCGIYNNIISTGASRIQIAFRQATFPDGSTLALDGMAAGDRNGWSGLSADVNNHTGAVIGSALLTSLVAGIAAATNPSRGGELTGIQQQTPGQAVGQNILGTGQQITNQKINVPPTLSLAKGTVANLNVDRAIILPPYHPMPSMDEEQ